MEVQKRDFKEREYKPYELPKGCILYTQDMQRVITCACCSKKQTFGYTYTSKAIHNGIGLGYPVCEECYNEELRLAEQYPYD